MAEWVKKTEKVVLIDGCFLRCRGRILESFLGKEMLIQFDALKVCRRFTDVFDIEDIPLEERQQAARQVAESALAA